MSKLTRDQIIGYLDKLAVEHDLTPSSSRKELLAFITVNGITEPEPLGVEHGIVTGTARGKLKASTSSRSVSFEGVDGEPGGDTNGSGGVPKVCSHCFWELMPEAKFCHSCTKPTANPSAGKCSGCQTQLAPGAKCCHVCGTLVAAAPAPGHPGQVPPSLPPAGPTPALFTQSLFVPEEDRLSILEGGKIIAGLEGHLKMLAVHLGSKHMKDLSENKYVPLERFVMLDAAERAAEYKQRLLNDNTLCVTTEGRLHWKSSMAPNKARPLRSGVEASMAIHNLLDLRAMVCPAPNIQLDCQHAKYKWLSWLREHQDFATPVGAIEATRARCSDTGSVEWSAPNSMAEQAMVIALLGQAMATSKRHSTNPGGGGATNGGSKEFNGGSKEFVEYGARRERCTSAGLCAMFQYGKCNQSTSHLAHDGSKRDHRCLNCSSEQHGVVSCTPMGPPPAPAGRPGRGFGRQTRR